MAEYQESEHRLARAWRERMGLSLDALSKATGYSIARIRDFETGVSQARNLPIGESEMARYRMVCAAVLAGLSFDWDELRVNPRPLMEAVDSCKTVMKRYA